MGSSKCLRGLSDHWSACFYCSYVVFSVFLGSGVVPKETDDDDDDKLAMPSRCTILQPVY